MDGDRGRDRRRARGQKEKGDMTVDGQREREGEINERQWRDKVEIDGWNIDGERKRGRGQIGQRQTDVNREEIEERQGRDRWMESEETQRRDSYMEIKERQRRRDIQSRDRWVEIEQR